MSTRSEKLDLRLTPEAKRTLNIAASAVGRSVSEFVLESALARAEETLADRRQFGLDADQWAAFMAALDAPLREVPRLRRLFQERSVFETPEPGMTAELRIEKLRRDHPVDAFDCGSEELNRFLIRFALPNQQANASQTYLALSDQTVVGFYTLVVGQVTYEDAPERLTRGLARHAVPIMLLARLAVSVDWQGRGLGSGLMKDAMRRTLQAADIAGIRAFVVHAKDDNARAFYEHFGFVASPADPFHLFVLMKDLRRIAGV